jgi:hypothetical protein
MMEGHTQSKNPGESVCGSDLALKSGQKRGINSKFYNKIEEAFLSPDDGFRVEGV